MVVVAVVVVVMVPHSAMLAALCLSPAATILMLPLLNLSEPPSYTSYPIIRVVAIVLVSMITFSNLYVCVFPGL